MAVGEEREVMVRTTLREVLIYLVFLFILIFGKKNPPLNDQLLFHCKE